MNISFFFFFNSQDLSLPPHPGVQRVTLTDSAHHFCAWLFSLQLLRVEPAERMTLDEAVRHPWLRDAVAEASSAKPSGSAKAASSASG